MSTSLKQAIENAKVRVSAAFDAVVAKGGTKPSVANLAALPSAIESIPSGGGIDFDGFIPKDGLTLAQAICSRNGWKKIHNKSLTGLGNLVFGYGAHLEELVFENLTRITYDVDNDYTNLICTTDGDYLLPKLVESPACALIGGTIGGRYDLSSLKYVRKTAGFSWGQEECILPSLVEVGSQMFYGNKHIQRLVVPSITGFNAYWASYANNLIDIECGAAFTKSVNNEWWNPTNALLTTSSSLVKDGEPFANNREKLLFNIREHIAANLPTITQGYSITFHANMKAAILADQATTEAFTNKGWTIA